MAPKKNKKALPYPDKNDVAHAVHATRTHQFAARDAHASGDVEGARNSAEQAVFSAIELRDMLSRTVA
jgi:hypothetical protein